MNKLAALIFLAAPVFAQGPVTLPPPAPEPVRKVVDIKHLSGERADRAIGLVKRYMHPVGSIEFEPSLKTAVLVGPEKVVTGAEALLAKFDSPGQVRPERQIQLRAYLVEASPDEASGAIPPEIAPAVEQMRKNFAFKGYRLLDTAVVICKNGVTASGTLPALSPERPDIRATYHLRVQTSSVLEDGKTVALRNFSFLMKLPLVGPSGHLQFSETNIATDLTLLAGQKLVVGKLAAEQPRNAIFLILTAEVQ